MSKKPLPYGTLISLDNIESYRPTDQNMNHPKICKQKTVSQKQLVLGFAFYALTFFLSLVAVEGDQPIHSFRAIDM